MLKTTYPALITVLDDQHQVTIPQFSITETANNQAEAIQKARLSLCSQIAVYEDTGREIPLPAADLDPGEDPLAQITLIDVDMEEYQTHHRRKTVHKNVNIPKWLDTAARKQGVNFSQVLTDALMRELQIQ